MCLLDDPVKGCKQGRSKALFSWLAGLGISASGMVLGPAPCGWVRAGAGRLRFECWWGFASLRAQLCRGIARASGATGKKKTSHRRVCFQPLKKILPLIRTLLAFLKQLPKPWSQPHASTVKDGSNFYCFLPNVSVSAQSLRRIINRTCLYKPERTVMSFPCRFWELGVPYQN